jgi:DNA polymerase I-like protein with 3'-5' exonuclease and polymerase domains
MNIDLQGFLIDLQHPQADKKPWMDEKHFELVTTETLSRVIDECIESGLYALDLETTGLDNRVFDGCTKDRIVGACFSPDGHRGYYAPLLHKGADAEPHNIPMSKFRSEMNRLLESGAAAIFHNGKFDQEFLQFNGGDAIGEWDRPKDWHDTLILAYLRNTRSRTKGLKALSKKELDMEMIEIKELFPAEHKGKIDFSILDPSRPDVLWYAASDAICTYLLFKILHPQVVEPEDGRSQEKVYRFEKACVAATRWMERSRIKIDKKKVAELIQIGQRELFEALDDVYSTVSGVLGRDIAPLYFSYAKEVIRDTNPNFDIDKEDSMSISELFDDCKVKASIPLHIDSTYPHLASKRSRKPKPKDVGSGEWPAVYDIMSAQQLGVMMDELKVPGLVRTEKSGQVKTSKDVLDKTIERAGDQFPWMSKIKRFREIQKALSTYLMPLWKDRCPSDDTVRPNFNGHRVDTGRFSAPADRNPKENGGTKFPFHGTPSTYDPNRPECLGRIRECIISREGKYIVAIDYAGVELRIVTNLSREPLWMAEFFHCADCDNQFERGNGNETPQAPPPFCPKCGSDKIGDLHTLTALSIYGEDARQKPEWKALRGNGKATNFALCYGGGGNAVSNQTGCDENEGWRIKRQFDSTYKGLTAWWKTMHSFGRKYGYVETAFGRHYPVPDIKLPKKDPKTGRNNGSFISKAERNSVNGPVQGTSADITKLAMVLVYKEVKKRGWFGKVNMLVTMHDELVFEIDGPLLAEAIPVISHLMANNDFIRALRWPIPLTVDVEIGTDWMVPWDLGKMLEGKKPFCEELSPYFSGGSSIPNTHDAPDKEAAPKLVPPKLVEESLIEQEPEESLNGEFVFQLEGSLTLGVVEKLAQTIHKCKDQGQSKLVLRTKSGDSIDLSSGPVLVNESQFFWVAKEYGL